MDLGIPCRRTTSLKNKFATCTTSAVSLQAIKCAILEYLSTTMKTKSNPRWVCGRPKIKSMERSSQGAVGIGKGIYKPVFWDCPLAA